MRACNRPSAPLPAAAAPDGTPLFAHPIYLPDLEHGALRVTGVMMGGESLGAVATCRSRTPYSPARQARAYPNLHTARPRRRERALRHARTFRCPHGQCLDPNYRQGVSQFHAFQTAQTAKREYSHTGPGGSPLQRLEPDDHSMQHNMQAYTYKTYVTSVFKHP